MTIGGLRGADAAGLSCARRHRTLSANNESAGGHARAKRLSNRHERGITMRKTAVIFLAAAAGTLATPTFPQNQSGVTYECDRGCLTGFVDAWMNGLIANDASAVPLAPDAKITLNDDVINASDAFWDHAASVQARIDIANPRWGETRNQADSQYDDVSLAIYVLRL